MITVLGALMGIDMQAYERPEGSNEMPPGAASSSSPPPSSTSSAPPPPPKAEPKKEEPAPMEEVEETEEDKEKKEAMELKAKAGELYKKRDFKPAAELYQKAWDTWPKDVTFLTNLAGPCPCPSNATRS